MKKLIQYFRSNYKGKLVKAPIPQGLKAQATGNSGTSTQCQCDCNECAGGDTSEERK